jgi:hypothetical protein
MVTDTEATVAALASDAEEDIKAVTHLQTELTACILRFTANWKVTKPG